jgi:hypothetical protein
MATFVEAQKGNDVLFVRRDEMQIENRTKAGKDPKKRPVTLHVKDKKWKCKMRREQFQRLVKWQQQAPAEPQATAQPPAADTGSAP